MTCGEKDPAKLQFDHIEPRTWTANRKGRGARIALYWREAMAGKIQLLCATCNNAKGQPEDPSLPPF